MISAADHLFHFQMDELEFGRTDWFKTRAPDLAMKKAARLG
jgi:hypothetical protein